MAHTELTDVLIPEIILPQVALRILTKSAFMNSGAILSSPDAGNFAKGNFGQILDLGRYNHIPDSEANISTDDATAGVPQAMTQVSVKCIKQMKNNGWSAADLVFALSQPDPFLAVSQQLGDYWASMYDRTAVSTVLGLHADNVDNDGGDMTYDIATDEILPVLDAEKISGEAVIRAMATLGDNMDDIMIIVVHSVVYANLQIRNLIETIPESNGVPAYPTYLGRRLIVSDYMPAVAGSNRVTYTTALVGANAFLWGEGAPKTPLEIDRLPSAGTGEGIETLWSREHFILTPTNYSWDDANAVMVGPSPTLAELQVATSWTRTVSRKDVKMAFLLTNG